MATVENKEAAVTYIEDGPKLQGHSDPNQLAEFDHQRTSRILRKIDFRLLPAIAVMYAICLIDRNNMSGLAVAGMTVELKIAGGFEYK